MHRHRNPFRQKGSGRENEFFEAIATMREGERYECPTTGAPPNDIGHAPPRRHDQQHDDNRPSHPDGGRPTPPGALARGTHEVEFALRTDAGTASATSHPESGREHAPHTPASRQHRILAPSADPARHRRNDEGPLFPAR